MLLWLAAAAAPWLIHLWLRKRQQVIDWGAMQWMLQAMQQQSRPMRIWQWILLFLRTSALVLLALAVAQPLGCRMSKSSASRAPRLHVLVLDASGSMQTKRSSGGTRWLYAVDQAIELCNETTAGDQFVVLRMESVPQYLIAEPTSDGELVKQTLQQATCGYSVADWNATHTLLLSLLEKLRADQPSSEILLTLWSDAQQATWQTALQVRAAAEAELGTYAALDFRNVGEAAPTENTAIASIKLPAQIPVATETIEVQGTAHHFGSRAPASQVVRLSVDGAVRESKFVTFSLQVDPAVSFQLKLPAGVHVITLDTDGDALTIDNRRWEVIEIRDRVHVAVLGPSDATQMIAAALVPDPAETTFDVAVGSVDDLALVKPSTDLIFLCDPPRLRVDMVQRLAEQVAQGASLWYWAGPRSNPAVMNRLLGEQTQPPLIPAKFGAASAVGIYPLDPREYRHPIIAPFANYPMPV